jgi:hypothetical protein
MDSGLVAHGVPAADAEQVAQLPAVAAWFGGRDPVRVQVKDLVSPEVAAVPRG